MAYVPSHARRSVMLQDRNWKAAWSALADDMQAALSSADLEAPDVWAHLLDDIEDDDDPELELLSTIEALVGRELMEDVDTTTKLCDLYQAAAGPATAFSKRTAHLDGSKVVLEHDMRLKRGHEDRERKELAKLAATDLAHLPSEWKAKRYRRAELPETANEREAEEERQRQRWVREVIGLLQEADTPFARSIGPATTTAVRERCCRHLRGPTLAKRVRDWRPLRRYLQTLTGQVWPNSADEILSYVSVRESEKAAKSVFSDLQATLLFFEQAAELPEDRRLADEPAVRNALQAASRAAALRPRPLGARDAQAPPLLLKATPLGDSARIRAR